MSFIGMSVGGKRGPGRAGLYVGALAIVLHATVAIGQTPAPRQTVAAAPASSEQAALDMLKKRPWYAAFASVLADANNVGRANLDPGFGDLWTETEALSEAMRRIENGQREGRPATTGAISDAIDLDAGRLMFRAGCYAALAQRPDFKPQAAALSVLRVDGSTPEPFRSAVKDYASAPCEAPQNLATKDFDPRKAYESGKRMLASAVAAGSLRPLPRFLEERNLLKAGGADTSVDAAREQALAEFRRFDAAYDGHADLLRNYRSLFQDYCPTDQRFCAMRDLLGDWGDVDKYCGGVTRYVASYYADASRKEYLPGAENDGLNRVWEAYHLKFAPACLAMQKRPDLAPDVLRRLEVMQSLFASDSKTLGDNGLVRLRDATRGLELGVQDAARADARIKSYRAAVGLDQPLATTAVASTQPLTPVVPPQSMVAMPSENDLRTPGSEASERELMLDRVQVLDIQERLAAIGGAVAITGVITQATRGSIRSWQGAVGLEPTGYLTRAQFDLLKVRTQDRWLVWRSSRTTMDAGGQVQPQEPRRRQQTRRNNNRRPAEASGRARGGQQRGYSDIPGAIAPYSWRW